VISASRCSAHFLLPLSSRRPSKSAVDISPAALRSPSISRTDRTPSRERTPPPFPPPPPRGNFRGAVRAHAGLLLDIIIRETERARERERERERGGAEWRREWRRRRERVEEPPRDLAQIKWRRLWRGRSAFSLMPLRALAMPERRQSSESLQLSLGRGCRGDRDVRGVRGEAMRCLDASYLRPTQRSLSRVIGRPLYHVTLSAPLPLSTPFRTCYVEYSTVSPDRKIFFRPPLDRRRKDPSRCL